MSEVAGLSDISGPRSTAAQQPAAANPAAAKYDRAFIVTYGRSGSTLLQGVLNALPGYRILGENYDVMRLLEALFSRLPRFGVQRAVDTSEKQKPSQPKDPFFGFENFNDAALGDGIRLFMEHVLLRGAEPAEIRCLGFKEIRYSPTDVAKKVEFMRRIFPGCAIIYNIRDPKDVVQSEFQKDKEVTYFEQFNALLENRSKADTDSFLVKYEDVASGSGTLEDLHAFLGEPFDRAKVEAVLSIKHSYHTQTDGQFYSNFPRVVQVNKNVQGLSLLVVDRLESQDEWVKVGGLMVPRDNAGPRRFKSVLSERGRSIPFRAACGLPSPGLRERMGSDAARSARFEVSFTRSIGEEHRLFFDTDELALTVRSDVLAPA